VFPSQIEEVLLKYDEFGSNFCMVIDNVNNLDRLTLQVEVRGLDEMADDAQAALSKGIVTGVKTSVGVTPKIELHAPYALPRDTSGQGKTACHRVDDRRSC
jgi:phenylacetate-CoA ligase